MALFVCQKCHCVENSATGWWWSKDNLRLILPPDMKEFEFGKGLCSECLPAGATFDDGTPVPDATGKWHGRWEKVHIDEFMKSETGKHYILCKDGYLLYKQPPSIRAGMIT